LVMLGIGTVIFVGALINMFSPNLSDNGQCKQVSEQMSNGEPYGEILDIELIPPEIANTLVPITRDNLDKLQLLNTIGRGSEEYANSHFVFTLDNHLAKQLYIENTARVGWTVGLIADIASDGAFINVNPGGVESPDIVRICAADGRQRWATEGLGLGLGTLQFNPDGTEVWVVKGNRIEAYSASNGGEKFHTEIHEVTPVAMIGFLFLQDKSVLAILRQWNNRTPLIFWDITTNQQLSQISLTQDLQSVTVNRAGTLIVAIMHNETLQVWGIPAD
jgi:hypothetical protein